MRVGTPEVTGTSTGGRRITWIGRSKKTNGRLPPWRERRRRRRGRRKTWTRRFRWIPRPRKERGGELRNGSLARRDPIDEPGSNACSVGRTHPCVRDRILASLERAGRMHGHPHLRRRRGGVSLSLLFGSGIERGRVPGWTCGPFGEGVDDARRRVATRFDQSEHRSTLPSGLPMDRPTLSLAWWFEIARILPTGGGSWFRTRPLFPFEPAIPSIVPRGWGWEIPTRLGWRRPFPFLPPFWDRFQPGLLPISTRSTKGGKTPFNRRGTGTRPVRSSRRFATTSRTRQGSCTFRVQQDPWRTPEDGG